VVVDREDLGDVLSCCVGCKNLSLGYCPECVKNPTRVALKEATKE
jgi:hypothetical protein